MRAIDLSSGDRYGRLVVVGLAGTFGRVRKYRFLCDCGGEAFATSTQVRKGYQRSCGCLKNELTISRQTTHGQSGSQEYSIWHGMIQRCESPRNASYKHYGAKGVTVCGRWKLFENFWQDMGPRPSSSHTLDRKDNSIGYEPGNCRWATRKEQDRNKSSNVRLVFGGRVQTATDWANELGIHPSTILARINRYGWTVRAALATPGRMRA